MLHRSEFTGANGTNITAYVPDVGTAFSVEAGTGEIQANKLRATSNPLLIYTDTGAADVIATAVGNLSAANGSHSLSIVLRYTDASNYWLAQAIGDGVARILRRQAGSFTIEDTQTWTPDTAAHTFVAVASGASIALSIDGVLVTSWGAATHNQAATAHGLRASFDVTGDEFDSFTVAAPPLGYEPIAEGFELAGIRAERFALTGLRATMEG